MQPDHGQRIILVVDDDQGLTRLIQKALQREGYFTAGVGSGRDVHEWLGQQRADLMLLDLKLQDISGKELVQELARANRCPPFIIITGQGDERVAVEMMKIGAMDYLVKDSELLQLVPEVVRRGLEQIDRERRLAEAEQRIRLIQSVVDQGFSAVLISDAALPDPHILYINPAFAQATGYEVDKLVGQPLSSLSGLRPVQLLLHTWPVSGLPFFERIDSYSTTLGERWGEWRVGPVKNPAGEVTHWLIIFRDITERKRLEKDILEISDRERQRIGQDLHDGICQHLAGIELMTQVLEQQLATRSKSAAARVGDIGRHVREAIAQTRSLARGLSPVTLEAEGLASALAELAAGAQDLFGVQCRFEASGEVLVRNPAVATHLYRIAQEAVANACKHGKAAEISIRLAAEGQQIALRVSDNGQGFPPGGPSRRGMGLRIMQYRASMIGGLLTLGDAPGGGALVACTVPAPS